MYLEPNEVLAIARGGAALGCKEGMFTLGDKPEDRWRQARPRQPPLELRPAPGQPAPDGGLGPPQLVGGLLACPTLQVAEDHRQPERLREPLDLGVEVRELPPFQVDALPAPDIAWVAWLGAAVNPDTAPARPYYLRAPDAKPSKDMLQKAAQPSAP